MSPTSSLFPIATWFLLGMTRIVVTSKLAEYRIDNPPGGHALAINRAARADNNGGLLLLVARSISRLARSIAAALRPRIHGLLASSFSVT